VATRFNAIVAFASDVISIQLQEESMNGDQLSELLFQALETELGGVQVYSTAIKCAQNEDLREEWQKYLAQTTHHVEIVTEIMAAFELDPGHVTPGREVVKGIGTALVAAMKTAQSTASAQAAELVAAECVILAESKDHLNWELLSQAAEKLSGERKRVLSAAVEEVEEQEDEHLYHTTGWARELWIQSLGMKAVLPPPEERKHVVTEIGAARAKQARAAML
jgi:rubrerythrin